jgi:hypothetical protein
MKIFLKFTFSILLILIFLTVSATYAQTYTGNVSIDSKQVKPGDKFTLDLRLNNNNIDIGGIFVPLKYAGDDIVFDSATFDGSLLTPNFTEAVSVQANNVVWISYIPSSLYVITPIVATEGLIAKLHFSVSQFAQQGLISIDSINEVYEVSPGIYYPKNIQVSDQLGNTTYYPDFTKGIVSISVPTDVDDNLVNGLPSDFGLSQNYPNPFNPSTIIEYSLPTASHVKLEIFNVLGQLVKTLVNSSLEAGVHTVQYDASDQSSGIFFYRLTHEQGVETKKMILVK